MVIFSHPAKPFAITPKGTIRRAFTLHSYDAEIENLYATIETYGGVTAPEEWNYDSSRTFVRAVVNKTLARPVNDEENLFAHGCDRLQSLQSCLPLLTIIQFTGSLDTECNIQCG